jgi:hypothetical protein
VVKVTTPADESTLEPRVVLPERNLTFPVGMADPLTAATVAVKVTGCPNTDGSAELVRLVVVAATTRVVVVLTTSGGFLGRLEPQLAANKIVSSTNPAHFIALVT